MLISPLRSSDLPEKAKAEWLSCIPASDTALMMGILRTLVNEGGHDRAFLERYTSGWPF